MKLLGTSLILIAFSYSGFGNFLVDQPNYPIHKVEEECRIQIEAGRAKVTCRVVYEFERISMRTVGEPVTEEDQPMIVDLPFFWPSERGREKDHIEEYVTPRLTQEGKTLLPYETGFRDHKEGNGFKNTIIGYAKFSISERPSGRFTLTSIYYQPIIDDIVYYEPNFEGETSPEKSEDFLISFTSSTPVSMELTTKHKHPTNINRDRIDILPVHAELIGVRIIYGEQDILTNPLPPTAPEDS